MQIALTRGAAAHLPVAPDLPGSRSSVLEPTAPFRIWFQQKHLILKGPAEKPAFIPVVHPPSISATGLTPAANSSPVYLRRPRLTTYRCSLPGLTGFAASRRAGPGYQRHLPRTVPAAPRPRAGIRPRYSGLRVQGTASSPPSTTNGHRTTFPVALVKPACDHRKTDVKQSGAYLRPTGDTERPPWPAAVPRHS